MKEALTSEQVIEQLKELPYCTCNDEPYAIQGSHRTSCPSQWIDDVLAELQRLKDENAELRTANAIWEQTR